MSSPKKGRTRYSPSSREAIWGLYRPRTSSMVRLELMTVRFSAVKFNILAQYVADHFLVVYDQNFHTCLLFRIIL